MKLSREKLIKGSLYADQLEKLIAQAEEAFKTWEPIWSPFVSAPVKKEIISIFREISDINCFSAGGFQNAERHRILIERNIF